MVAFSASKYNFGINNSTEETAAVHIATSSKRVHSHIYFFRRKFWASKAMYRGSAADFLAVLCKTENPTTNNATKRRLHTFSNLSSA